jgi:hypothetical protein
MKWIAPILLGISLIQFTTPGGKPIWIVPSQVVAVTHPNGECAEPSQSRVVTSYGASCLQETQDEVIRRLQSAP